VTQPTPPKLATVLLRWLGPDGPALAGDLAERHQSGESRWWYWRQVIGIIAAATATEVQRHPIITIRAIAFGFAFTWVIWSYNVIWVVMNYDELLFRTGLGHWFYAHGYGLPRWTIWPLTAVLYASSGWIVARVSRQSAAILLVYAAVGEFLFFAVWGAWRFVYDPLPHFLLAILTLAVRPTPILCGGLWAISRGHSAERRLHA
jgi:hypothetical protein